VLDRLQQFAGRPVIDSRYYGANLGMSFDSALGMGGGTGEMPGGVVQLVLGGEEGGHAAVEFDVEQYAGCYFVSFA